MAYRHVDAEPDEVIPALAKLRKTDDGRNIGKKTSGGAIPEKAFNPWGAPYCLEPSLTEAPIMFGNIPKPGAHYDYGVFFPKPAVEPFVGTIAEVDLMGVGLFRATQKDSFCLRLFNRPGRRGRVGEKRKYFFE